MAKQRLAQVGEIAVRRLVASGEPRHVFGLLGQRQLAVLQHGRCLGSRVGGLCQPLVVALGGLGQLAGFPFKLGDGLAGVAVERAFPLDVEGDLLDPAGQRLDAVLRTGLLFGQRVALHREALQNGGGNGLFLAKGRQRLVALGARAFGGAGGVLGLRSGSDEAPENVFRRLTRVLGLHPAAVEQQTLGLPKLGADGAVALRLLGLPVERSELCRKLLDHVVDAQQVRLGVVKLQLRLVAALVKARDARGFLEDPAPVLRLGVDQLGDLPLPHQRRRMRPGRGVCEEHLHVARAHVLGVHLVSRANVAGDPPDDLELVLIVETRRGEPVAVVDGQRHLGEVPGGARVGACEDHVFHARAAHRLGAVLAHHPAQRLEQVGLAAAVRADDSRQPVGNDEIRGINEALEARQSKPCELHCRVLIPKLAPNLPPRRDPSQTVCTGCGGRLPVVHKILRELRHICGLTAAQARPISQAMPRGKL